LPANLPARQRLLLTSGVFAHKATNVLEIGPSGYHLWPSAEERTRSRGRLEEHSGSMQQVPRLLDVGMHLPDQCLFPRILHLAAEPGVEIDCDLYVV
jgi:hypothetical protein